MIELIVGILSRRSGKTDEAGRRELYGLACSGVAIVLNILLAAGKFIVGTATGSVAVTADALNNLSDVWSCALTLLGFRVAGRKPDEKHPFGHARMEYIAGLIVAALILHAGADAMQSAISRIFHPETPEFSWVAVGVLAASILVKVYMSYFYRRVGKKIASPTLQMSGDDALNDTLSTALALACMLLFRFTGWDLDAYAGAVVALLILKTGVLGAKETIDPLLGERANPELADEVRRIVLSYPEILGVHDLVIHDYGPGRCHVSLHAEVDCESNIYEVHERIDHIMSELDHKLGCFSVIHMDPVDTKNERLAELREETAGVVRALDGKLSMHDFRMVPGKHRTNLIFDLLVPYDFRLTDEEVRTAVRTEIETRHPDCRCIIQIDKSFT